MADFCSLYDRLRCRDMTYKRREDVLRSFLKWVCKRELYGTLYIVQRGKWTFHERGTEKYNYGGVGFRHGYPQFHASRSEARRQWEAEFKRHREQWLEKAQTARSIERDAEDRLRLATDKNNSRFFQLLAGASIKL